jgi:hypothetical protein
MHQVGPGVLPFADDLGGVADDEITARVDGDRPAAPFPRGPSEDTRPLIVAFLPANILMAPASSTALARICAPFP